MSDGVVSFISQDKTGQKRKFQQRRSYVSADYSSGSDGDVDSDRETENNTSPIKKLRKPKTVVKKRRSDDEESSEESDADGAGDTGRKDEAEVDDVSEDQKPIPGAGWADVMAKIIGRPAATTTPVVLSKSTAYQKAKEAEKEELTEKQNLLDKKKEADNIGREKPQALKKDAERRLQRIATRGVVQFFNAVGKQQKLREERLREATTENKRIAAEKSLSKGEFLDMLKTSKISTEKVTEGAEKPGWDVLGDDYMMGAEMKDWDEGKEGDDQDEGGGGSSSSSGEDSD